MTKTKIHWEAPLPAGDLHISAHFTFTACGLKLSGMSANSYWSWRIAKNLVKRNSGYLELCPDCAKIATERKSDHSDGLTGDFSGVPIIFDGISTEELIEHEISHLSSPTARHPLSRLYDDQGGR